jgi:hypothetical protein
VQLVAENKNAAASTAFALTALAGPPATKSTLLLRPIDCCTKTQPESFSFLRKRLDIIFSFLQPWQGESSGSVTGCQLSVARESRPLASLE